MHREGAEIHVTEEEAKGGRKGSHVFRILAISLVLVVIAMLVMMAVGVDISPFQPEAAGTATSDGVNAPNATNG
jgi:predicted metalloprotease